MIRHHCFVNIYKILVCFWYIAEGLDHIAEHILSFIDADSLLSAELVCKEWYHVIRDGHLWRKLIESKVKWDSLWKGLADRKGW